MTITVREGVSRPHPAEPALTSVVSAIGEDRFGPALAQYLHSLCGADHFAAFRLGHDELREVAACCVEPERTAHDIVQRYVTQGWWRRDPAMNEAQRCLMDIAPRLIHVDFSDNGWYADMRPRLYPHVRDRLLLCGHSGDTTFGLSILRADGHSAFPSDAIDKVFESADLLMAVLAKHVNVSTSRPNVAEALTALSEIENCINATHDLPRREAEVCARILYGLSSMGIALDLTVSEETVKTYRKRAYQRLSIGSERELLTWYLAHWSRWRGPRFDAALARSLH